MGKGGEHMTSTLHDRTIRYLTATGWVPPEKVGELGGLWRHPDSQLLLPVPNDLTTAGVDWQLILERISAVEGVTVEDVSRTIEQQAVDVANLRAANDIVIRDSIPYWAGVTLVQSSWVMLRASATTAMGQRALIRNYSSVGDGLATSARMAHTRRGSFIIPILMPISEPVPADNGTEEPLSGLEISEPPEPPERRVMRTFAEALATLDAAAIQPAREPRAGIDAELVRAGVSSQFVSALHKVLSQESVDEFSAQFDWSPARGRAPQVSQKVSIPSAAS